MVSPDCVFSCFALASTSVTVVPVLKSMPAQQLQHTLRPCTSPMPCTCAEMTQICCCALAHLGRACKYKSRSARTTDSAETVGLTLLFVPLRRLLLAAAANAGVEARQTWSCSCESTAWLLPAALAMQPLMRAMPTVAAGYACCHAHHLAAGTPC